MWALRRASISLRLRGFSVGTSRACCVKLTSKVEEEAGIIESPQILCTGCLSFKTFHSSGKTSLNSIARELSSQADARSKKEEDDMEYELETPVGEAHDSGGNDVELIPEQDSSYENEGVEELNNDLKLSDTAIDSTGKESQHKGIQSELFKAITRTQALSVNTILERWVKEGKKLSRSEISLAIHSLRRLRMYGKALQLSDWIEAKQKIDLTEKDHTSRLDLIAKVRGLYKAEIYIERIPKSSRGEQVYRALLINCVSQNNMKKAEEVFSKMKDLKLLSILACNQMLLLYTRTDKRKIASILSLMEKENIKPSLASYKILIEAKGRYNDMAGMEQIVETMKAEGVEPDIQMQLTLAKNYASAGLKEKAEAALKEIEGGNLKENRWLCHYLLIIYADWGKTNEVERIWRVCESDPQTFECLAAIEAWGKLKKIEEAEAIFEMMMDKWKKLTSRQYAVLLRVYTENNMLTKGKDLIKQMANDSGRHIGPFTWDALVRLHVQAGEVERADSLLHKGIRQTQLRPMYGTYMAILHEYAKRGDVHNSEKNFCRMRQAGYTSQVSSFRVLMQAYVNAKLPAYGMRERMKAANISPNKALSDQLDEVDAFRRTTFSDLFD